MSRIGLAPIKIEDGVTVNISDGAVVLSGPMGENSVEVPDFLKVEEKEGHIYVTLDEKAKGNKKFMRSMYGTIRSLISNAAVGVKDGFEKKLEIVGVGYRVKPEGTDLSLTLGWNHPVQIEAPEGITFEVPDETTIVVKGKDKQLVGETAARIRQLRKPEPYKGKGIRYEGEYVRRKTAKVVVAE